MKHPLWKFDIGDKVALTGPNWGKVAGQTAEVGVRGGVKVVYLESGDYHYLPLRGFEVRAAK